MRLRSIVWGVCLAGTLGCHGPAGSVQSLTVQVAVAPASLDFGPVYLQATATQNIQVRNQGTAAETATVTVSGSGFSATGGPTFALPPGATTQIPIAFNPTVPSTAQATVLVSWDEGSASVSLTGIGHVWPDCTPDAPCEVATFDPQAGLCRTSQLSDGSACDGGTSTCLQDSRCQAGQCVGVPLDCNDNDVCTLDACVEGQGCVHQDQSASCTGTDPCQVYACDPNQGCTSSNAPNGTLCSNHESCQTAEICILGKCVGTPVPDGFPCALWWAPCATDAECHKGTCDSPSADAEKPGDVRWTWQPDGGTLPTALDVPAVDELGNSYVCGSSDSGGWASGEMDLASLDQCGLTRWQNPDFRNVTTLLLAGQELVFVNPATNELVAVYRDTGQLLWKVSLIPTAIGADGGDGAGCYQVQLSALALSPTGPIYAAGTIADQCSLTDALPQPLLAAILPNGTVVWAEILQDFLAQSFGQGLMVDRQGNSYLREIVSDQQGVEKPGPYVASFDPQGVQRLMLPLGTDNAMLALGTDRLVEGIGGELWNLDGGALNPLDAGGLPGPTSSITIDGQDNIFVVANSSYLGASLAAFAADAPNPTWTFRVPSYIGNSNLALGENQLFVALAEYCSCPVGTPTPGGQPVALSAVNTLTGAQLWTTSVTPGAYPYPSGTLTLANTATLILASGGQVTAFFAGQQSPPDNAPWSRAGGSYSNQSSSAPPAQPMLPAGTP